MLRTTTERLRRRPVSIRRLLIVVVIAGFGARLLSAAAFPLLDDETYYWLWSKHLAASYVDHPPFIAYLISVTTVPGDGALWLRAGPLVTGVLISLGLFMLGREMFDERAGVIAALVFQIVPVLAGAGFLATPDAPLFLWWVVAMLCAWRAASGHVWWWVPAGAAVGLGLLSKLPMLLLAAGLLGFVITARRAALGSWPLSLGAALALGLFAPVVAWNVRNDWAAVRFILHERPAGTPTGLAGLLEITLQQFAFVLVLFVLFLWALGAVWRRRSDDRFAFLLWSSLPTLVLTAAAAALSGVPHGNWAGPAYLGLAVALGALWPGRAALVTVTANVVLMAYAAVLPVVPLLPPIPGSPEALYGWPQAARRAEELAEALPPPVVIAADRYQTAAQIAYYTRRRLPVTIYPAPPRGSIWPVPSVLSGASVVWVTDAQWAPLARPEEFLPSATERDSLRIVFRGKEVRRFRFWTSPARRL